MIFMRSVRSNVGFVAGSVCLSVASEPVQMPSGLWTLAAKQPRRPVCMRLAWPGSFHGHGHALDVILGAQPCSLGGRAMQPLATSYRSNLFFLEMTMLRLARVD